MFTGLIEDMGTVVRLIRRGGGARLEVRAQTMTPQLRIGDSIAVNGACVTVTEHDGTTFACDLVPETVARTNLGIVQIGEQVNLEMPMRAGDRFGGHIVQGHVDCVGLVRSRRRAGAQEMLEVTVPFELTRYLAPQGSVAIDGISLTVVGVDRDRFRVALIPHTVSVTTLGQKGQGASVNVEVDVLSKYVERHLSARATRPSFLAGEDAPLEEAKREEAKKAEAKKAEAARASDARKSEPKKAEPRKPEPRRAAPVAAARKPVARKAAAKQPPKRATATARKPTAPKRAAKPRPKQGKRRR